MNLVATQAFAWFQAHDVFHGLPCPCLLKPERIILLLDQSRFKTAVATCDASITTVWFQSGPLYLPLCDGYSLWSHTRGCGGSLN